MTLYRCTAIGAQPSGRQWSMRLHFTSGSSIATVNTDWSAKIADFWLSGTYGVETLFPTTTGITQTKVESLTVVTVGAVDKIRSTGLAFTSASLVGTSANASLPDQNAVVVSLRSALPGREGRGRFHLPAPDETLVTAGEMGATPSTRVHTAATALRTGMSGLGHTEVVLTYVKSKIGTPVGSFQVITSEDCDRVIRTVRGRVKSRRAVYV